MNDVEIAQNKLISEGFNLVIVKRGKVLFQSRSKGINGFLSAIDRLKERLTDASLADSIVGRAAAMLCVYTRTKSVFALVMSRRGMRILDESNISYRFEKGVSNILNADKTDLCPFEKIVADIGDPKVAFETLTSLT